MAGQTFHFPTNGHFPFNGAVMKPASPIPCLDTYAGGAGPGIHKMNLLPDPSRTLQIDDGRWVCFPILLSF